MALTVHDLAKKLDFDRHNVTSFGEVMEYAGMLASAAGSRDVGSRTERIQNLLMDLAACALQVAFTGDKAIGFEPDNLWVSVDHEQAIYHFRNGTWVRGKHWNGAQARMLQGICEVRVAGQDGAPQAVVDRVRDELLSGKVDGRPIQWQRELEEEIPF